MHRVVTIFCSLLCFLAAIASAFSLIGRPALLRHASTVKPYARIFQTPATPAPDRDTDRRIIFFGDSSVVQPPWSDANLPGIPSLLETELRESFPGPGDTTVIDWSFHGGRLFHYYCLLFEAHKRSPTMVVIPINWRSIGPQSEIWKTRAAFPELSGLVPRSEATSPSFKRIMRAEGISRSRWIRYQLYRPILYVIGFKMWFRTSMGMEMEKDLSPAELLASLPPEIFMIDQFTDVLLFRQYANEIPQDDPQLKTLQTLVDVAERRGMKLLFYIVPIHLGEMRLRPAYDDALFRESIERVVAATGSETSVCLDLSGLLKEENFIDVFEHYTVEGNRRIAHALVPAAADLLGAADRNVLIQPKAGADGTE